MGTASIQGRFHDVQIGLGADATAAARPCAGQRKPGNQETSATRRSPVQRQQAVNPDNRGIPVALITSTAILAFPLEHTFRFLKQHLGWTRPKLRDPAAADRWTWIIIAAYAQLHLARDLAADIRLP